MRATALNFQRKRMEAELSGPHRRGATCVAFGGALIALLLAGGDARAEFEAGAYGGYHRFAETNRLGRFDQDTQDTAFAGTATFGARLAYLPIRYVGVEAQVAVAPTITNNDRSTATVVHLRGHVIGTLPLGKFRPFVLLGAGAAGVTPADPVYLRRDTDLNFHAGVGTRFDVQKLWGIRVDVQTAAVPRTDRSGFALDHTFSLGLYGNFPWPANPPPAFDKDNDDITDDKDECPEEAGEIRFGGCPDPDAEPAEKPAEEETEAKPDDAKKDDAKPDDTKKDDTKKDDTKKDEAPPGATPSVPPVAPSEAKP